MLQVVDAERNRLAEADRAEVAGHFDTVLVCLLDGRAQLGPRDLGIGLEPGDALFGPVAHQPGGIFGAGQRVHCAGAGTGALQIRTGHEDVGSGLFALSDRAFEVELLIGVDASRRPDGGHAGAQEEAWIALQHRLHRAAGGRAVVHVIVEPDDARHDGMARQVDSPGAVRNGRAGGRTHGGDFVAADDDGLAGASRRARAVDQPDVGQRHNRLVDADVARDHGLELARRLRGKGTGCCE